MLTGGHTGEFMLWNGTAFNFETVMDVGRCIPGSGNSQLINLGTLRSIASWSYIVGVVA